MNEKPAVLACDEGFDEVVLPHLDAGYRLARWLLRNKHDAEDVVQEASLRAFRYFETFTGGDGRAWFLRIVRNACRDCHARRRGPPFDSLDEKQIADQASLDPETLMLRTDNVRLVERVLRALPDSHRVLLVLRELEDLSYREIAQVMDVPLGTVMSGLSRARQAFRRVLDDELKSSAS
ncbi:MAG TPA: sigma-70 family RNA polymerase sigma factor [Vicinamibacterales bacterium]